MVNIYIKKNFLNYGKIAVDKTNKNKYKKRIIYMKL